VVGTVVIPSLGSAGALAGTAYTTYGGLRYLGKPDNQYFVVRIRKGVDPHVVTARLTRLTGGIPPTGASVPAEIERIRQINDLPALIAAITVTIALIAVAYTLVVSVRRRRRDLAILKTVGFTRGQARRTVAVQATTIAIIAMVVGAIFGLFVGNQIWRLVANELGVARAAAVPFTALVVLVPLGVVIVNLIAAIPARAAARIGPAVVLRSE
jgi:predicted lysophospholipase L1 biosynthesis ABC-type transport system permease subunit